MIKIAFGEDSTSRAQIFEWFHLIKEGRTQMFGEVGISIGVCHAQESGENYIMRSLMICTPNPILCG